MPYDHLGKRELPILSVLTITGLNGKTEADIFRDTIELAVFHLKGGEWCDNAKGLGAYSALIRHFEAEDSELAKSWNMEYFLGTFGALKYYAWKYFDKLKKTKLAAIYKTVHNAWQEAFRIKKEEDVCQPDVKAKIAALLKSAYDNECIAVDIMEKII